MSVKAGKFLTVANQFLMDRLQSTGASNVNVPTERILETGNELAVATIRDVPDLTAELESLDVTVETEAMITNVDETTLVDGDVIDFGDAMPVDIISPIKAAGTSKVTTRGVIVPQLQLESAAYRFGVRANATQTFSFRGDTQYAIPGTPYREVFDQAGTGPYNLAHTPIKVVEKGEDIYALSVCVYKADGTYARLFHGTDYTDDNTGEINLLVAPGVGSKVAICYGSATTATFAQTVHPTPSVKPAAVRGKDIDLYLAVGPARSFTIATASNTSIVGTGSAFTSADIGGKVVAAGVPAGATITAVADATHATISIAATATATGVVTTFSPPLIRWAGVQSVDLTWRVSLEAEDELGNQHHVTSDYDVPEVSGSVTMRPATIEYLFDRIAQIANVPTNQVAGLLSSQPLEMQIQISHPDTGARLKTFQVPDARVVPPGIQARVNQKLEPQFPWSSDSGALKIYKGAPA